MNINEKHFSIGDITIINDDCLKYLETLEDNSIDCCITDPPYFIDKLDDSWDSKKVTERKNNSHIKHLPKNEYYVYDESSQMLQSDSSKHSYSLGDFLNVKIEKVDVFAQRIDLRIMK